jgi:hypothetical protein
MAGTCNTYVRDEKWVQNFGRKTLQEETTRKTQA